MIVLDQESVAECIAAKPIGLCTRAFVCSTERFNEILQVYDKNWKRKSSILF